MNIVVFLLNVLVVLVVSGGPAWKDVQRGGGLKVDEFFSIRFCQPFTSFVFNIFTITFSYFLNICLKLSHIHLTDLGYQF